MASISPKLKPLLLPQLVEERKRTEERQSLNLSQSTIISHMDAVSVYGVTSSCYSDVTTPITPTFSARGHSRYGSSCSSLDLSSTPCDSPCSPAPTLPTPAKRALPDVQEEPTERDDDSTLPPEDELYCLCDEACMHREDMNNFDFDYDLGCLSDGDLNDRFSVRRREQESAFTGIATRLGSRFSNFARWRPSKRTTLTASPTCELSFENAYPMSLTASSRSSSLSGPSYTTIFDRTTDAQLASWQSIESINSPTAIEIEEARSVRASIERDRALATTPLLPPLMTAPPPEDDLASPLELPAVAPSSGVQSPALSTRPSNSSLQQQTPLAPMSPEMPSPMHSMLPECDEWSDRLGHANFTIFPEPYQPSLVDLETLRKFLEDWDTARVSYTQHLLRTGEHYGTTGKIYLLTEAKWAETEHQWKSIHDILTGFIRAATAQQPQPQPQHQRTPSIITSRSDSRGRGRSRSRVTSKRLSFPRKVSCEDDFLAGIEWRRVEEDLPTAICKMLEETDKFPGLSDNGIVGPMERDEVMVRTHSEERKRSRFWKSLVDKVRK
jgi:hypothetical protein